MAYNFKIIPPYNLLLKIEDNFEKLNFQVLSNLSSAKIKDFFINELKLETEINFNEIEFRKNPLSNNIVKITEYSIGTTFNFDFNKDYTAFYIQNENYSHIWYEKIFSINLREDIYRMLILNNLLIDKNSFKNIIKKKYQNYTKIYNNIEESLKSNKIKIGEYKIPMPKSSTQTYYSLTIFEDGSLRFKVLNPTPYDNLNELLNLFIEDINPTNIKEKLSEYNISYNDYGDKKIYIDKNVQIDIKIIKDKTFFSIYHPLNKKYYFKEFDSKLGKEIYKLYSFKNLLTNNNKNKFKKNIKNKFPNYANNNFLSQIFEKKNIKEFFKRPIPNTSDNYYSLTMFGDESFKYELLHDMSYELFLEEFLKNIDFLNKNNSKKIKNTLLNFLSSSISLTDEKFIMKDTLIYINFINNNTYFSIYNVIDKKYNYIHFDIDLTEFMNKIYNNIKILSKIFKKKYIEDILERPIPNTSNNYYSLTMFEGKSFKYELLNDMPYDLFIEDFSEILNSLNKNNSKNKLLNFLSSSISTTNEKYIMKNTLIYINFINNNTYFSIYNVIEKKYNYIHFDIDLTKYMERIYDNTIILSKIFQEKNIIKSLKMPILNTDNNYYSLTMFDDESYKYELLEDMPYDLFIEDFPEILDLLNKNISKNFKNKLLNFLSSSISITDEKYIMKNTLIYINFINNFINNNTYFSIYNVIEKKYNYLIFNKNLKKSMDLMYNNIEILSKIFEKKKSLGEYKRPYIGGGYYYSLTIFEGGRLKYELLNDMPYTLLLEDLLSKINFLNKNNSKKLSDFLSESIYCRDSKGLTGFNRYSGKYVIKNTLIYINFINNNTFFSVYNLIKEKYNHISLNVDLSKEIYKKYSSEKILNNKNGFKKIIINKFSNYDK